MLDKDNSRKGQLLVNIGREAHSRVKVKIRLSLVKIKLLFQITGMGNLVNNSLSCTFIL